MKKLLTIVAGLLLSVNVHAGGTCVAGLGSPCSDNEIAIAGAAAKAKADAAALAASLAASKSQLVLEQNHPAAKIPEPSAIAPNPHAAPPSASCWIGASVTAAVSEFGIGVSGMEWDPICGLWLAAQQVDGNPQKEAATAAFCMTMEKAGVESPTCNAWDETQVAAVALNPDNLADVTFSGSGSSGGWGR